MQAKIDEEEENSQCTPLHMAAGKAHVEVVRELLQAGASINSVDGVGQQALHRAASAGCATIVRLLLADGAKINAADMEGMTPLHLCMYEQHEAATVALLEAGANTSAKNQQVPRVFFQHQDCFGAFAQCCRACNGDETARARKPNFTPVAAAALGGIHRLCLAGTSDFGLCLRLDSCFAVR